MELWIIVQLRLAPSDPKAHAHIHVCVYTYVCVCVYVYMCVGVCRYVKYLWDVR